MAYNKVRNIYMYIVFTISVVIQRAVIPSGPFSYVGYISVWQELPGGHQQRGNLCPGSESWKFYKTCSSHHFHL